MYCLLTIKHETEKIYNRGNIKKIFTLPLMQLLVFCPADISMGSPVFVLISDKKQLL